MATLRTKDLRNYMTSNLDVSSYTRMSRKNTDTVRDMVSFSLKVLAKFGLFAQKITRVLAEFFATACMFAFSLTCARFLEISSILKNAWSRVINKYPKDFISVNTIFAFPLSRFAFIA